MKHQAQQRGTVKKHATLLGLLAVTPVPIDLNSSGLPVTVLEAREPDQIWYITTATLARFNHPLDPWLVLRLEAPPSAELDPRLLVLSLKEAADLSLRSEQGSTDALLSLFTLPGWQVDAPFSTGATGSLRGDALLAVALDDVDGDELVVGEQSFAATRNGAEGAVTVLYPAKFPEYADSVSGQVLSLENLQARRLVGEEDEALGTGLLSLEGLIERPGLALLAQSSNRDGAHKDVGRVRLLDVETLSGDCALSTAPDEFQECPLSEQDGQIVLEGDAQYSHLGTAATLVREGADVVGLALSASGYASDASAEDVPGMVYLFSQGQLESAWKGGALSLTYAAATIEGSSDEALGSSLLSVPLASGGQRLYVGAYNRHKDSDGLARGALYAWNGLSLAQCEPGMADCQLETSALVQVPGDASSLNMGQVMSEGTRWDGLFPKAVGAVEPDGLNEVWLGMPGALGNQGRVMLASSHLWEGNGDGVATLQPLLDLRTSEVEQLGQTVLMTDLNGNGEPEALLIAVGSDQGVAGKVYILWDPGLLLVDRDGDGVLPVDMEKVTVGGQTWPAGDCDDSDATLTGANDDHDSAIDCIDCDDMDASIYPGAPVTPGNDPEDKNCDGNHAMTWGFQDEHAPSSDPGGCLSWTTYDPVGSPGVTPSPTPAPSKGSGGMVLLSLSWGLTYLRTRRKGNR